MAVAGKKKKIFDDRYEISSIVGRGAQSVVYRAAHIDGDRHEVALKVLLKPKSSKISGSDLLRKEALAMVSSRHKYVIRLDDFHSVDDLCYLSMEYAPEADLRKYTAKLGGSLPIETAERFLGQISEAMNFIHLAGILHRDIKPDNILVVDENSIRLGDFGVAVLPGEESTLEELQSGVGTMDYMAPEVLAGTGYDQRADIYGIGIIFYEILGGTHPFEGTPLAQQLNVRQEGAFPHLSELNPDVPDYLSSVVMRAMSYDPEVRYQTARELLQDLKKLRTESGAPAPTAQTQQAAPQKPAPPQNVATQQETPATPAPQAQAPATPPQEAPAKPQTSAPASQSQGSLTDQVEVTKTKPSSGSAIVDNSPTADPLGDAAETSPRSLKRRKRKRRPRAGIRSTRQGQAASEVVEASPEEPQDEIILAEPPEQTASGGGPASSPSMSPPVGHHGPGLQLGAQVVQSAFGGSAADSVAPAASEPEVVSPEPVAPEIVPEPVQVQNKPVPPSEPEPEPRYEQKAIEPEVVVEQPEPTPRQTPQEPTPPFQQEDSRPNRAFTAAAFAAGAPNEGFPGQEVADDPFAKKQPKGAGGRKGSSKRSVKSKRKRSAARAKASATKGGMNPIVMAGAVLLVLFLVYPKVQEMFSGEDEYIDESTVVEQTMTPSVFSESAEPIRAESLNMKQFPLIPSGVYAGSLSGVIPGRTTPLTIISLQENDALTVILGIPGWTPVTFSFEDLRKEYTKTSLNRLKLASNGIVLELNGEAQNGELIGELKNITTGEIGQWSIVPIK